MDIKIIISHTFFLFHLLLILIIIIPILASSSSSSSSSAERQVYIVYFGQHDKNGGVEKTMQEVEEKHYSHLLSVKKSEEDAKSSLLYSYKHSINGFAALLTPQEASLLSEKDEVVSVYKSNPRKYTLQTTRSWEFSGLNKLLNPDNHLINNTDDDDDVLLKSRYGKNIIIGIVDSGVWPESKSFRGKGLGPIPQRWKGICQTGDKFNSSHCNRKIIGARYYLKGYEQFYGPLNRSTDYKSPRDKDGHGTHTASTAGGRRVHNVAALGGFARGTASGGAPLARLAIYKVCWPIPGEGKEAGNTCLDEDMLAGMDDAIADGVDVMSISIGTANPVPFVEDSIAIGALHAIKRNIVVACSAGNSGPKASTMSNGSPWIITVGASSMDRSFIADLKLGNGEIIQGQSVSPYKMEKNMMYPLVNAAQVAKPDVRKNETDQCLPGSLSPERAKGKIVLCFRGAGARVRKGVEVKNAGGIGYILANSKANGEELTVDPHLLPATAVGYANGLKILRYINSTKNPVAYIEPAKTVLKGIRAPIMAAFSSRGPNAIYPDVIKPDITAPGLNILAAWSEGSSPTKMGSDHRVTKYNILSGTSMSCPHVGGAVALIKSIHPTWSSAAIRSAIMTTATLRDNTDKMIGEASGLEANPFQFGSGHFRPSKAADPGLVYDATYKDYLLFLCSNGVYNIDPSFKCPENPPPPNALNHPSVAIPKLNGTAAVKRTVTNVGCSKSLYFASVKPPLGISVKISPPILYFKNIGQKKTFTITVKVNSEMLVTKNGEYLFGWLTWNDGHGVYSVRSLIAVSLA